MLKYFVTIIKKLITVTNSYFFHYSNVINKILNNPLINTKQQQIKITKMFFKKKKNFPISEIFK